MLLDDADLAEVLLGMLKDESTEVQDSTGAAGRERDNEGNKDISLGERLTALFDRRK